jgi:hypothetical protein
MVVPASGSEAKQSRKECAVLRTEPHPRSVELPFKDRDLVA